VGNEFDAAGGLSALDGLADDPDDVLGADVLDRLEQLGFALLFKYDLNESLAVANDEEDEPAKVADLVYVPRDGDLLGIRFDVDGVDTLDHGE